MRFYVVTAKCGHVGRGKYLEIEFPIYAESRHDASQMCLQRPKPNEKWLTDITEFSIKAGKVYLSPIIDCFDGKPIERTIGTSPNAQLVNSMLQNAIKTLKPNEQPIVHSDRGCHYRWPEWISMIESAGLTRSMSKKGCSPDNSACEGFFGHLKTEMFYGRNWDQYTIEEFIQEIDDYMH